MAECERIRIHLAARAAGEPGGRTRRRVEAHLRRCEACRDEAARLERTAAILAGSALADVPAPGEEAVDWERFRRETAARAFAATRWPARRLALALAATAILAVGLPVAVRFGLRARAAGGPVRTAVASEAALAGPEAPEFLRDLEVARGREQASRLLRSGRDLLVQLAAAPAYCERERRDMAVERDASLRLLRQKEMLDPRLDAADLGRSRGVCDDLERVLRSVATLDDCPDAGEVQEILSAAASRDLLPRIDAALQGLGEEEESRA